MKVSGPPAWLALPVINLLVAVILAGPAEMMGRCFRGPRAVDRLPQHLIRSFSASVSSVHVLPSSPHGRLGAGGVLAFLALATGVRMRVVYAVSGVVVVGMILGETLTGGSWSRPPRTGWSPSRCATTTARTGSSTGSRTAGHRCWGCRSGRALSRPAWRLERAGCSGRPSRQPHHSQVLGHAMGQTSCCAWG
jgi:hypothetical protein